MFDEKIEKLNEETEQEAEAVTTQVWPGKRTYTIEDIQNILGISRPTAYKLVNSKQFHAVKIGQQIRIPVKAFDAWLEGTATA